MHHNNFMGGGNFISGGFWIQILAVVFIVLSFYFTLTFFQQLKSEDQSNANQSKQAAIVCLALGLAILTVYSLLFLPMFIG